MQWRGGYALAALVLLATEIAIALFVPGGFVRTYVGDGLAVILVYAGLRSVSPWRWQHDLAAALAIAVLIEVAQYLRLLDTVGLGEQPILRVVLGTSFDAGDLLAYAIGGAAVAVFETARR